MGDTQRWLELARRGKLKCLHEVTATHLLLPESISQSRNPARVLRFIRSAKELIEHYLEKYDCPSNIRKAALERTGIGVLRWAFEAGDVEVAKNTFAEYRTLGAGNILEARLCYFGSHSHFRWRIVRPALVALKAGNRARQRIDRILGAG